MHVKEIVLKMLLKIPKGKVVTYKELAKAANTSPRTVGQILRKNKLPERYPCYRVVKSSGELGGYLGKNYSRKEALLRKDGIRIENGKIDLSVFSCRIKSKK